MDFDFVTETITPVLLTAGAAILNINTTAAIGLPSGTTAQRPPTPLGGYTRFNSSLPALEYWNGTVWSQIGTGTVTSVTVSSASTSLTSSGSPITAAGTITLTLNAELQALGQLAVNGIVTRTAAGTYIGRTITGGTGLTVADGDGVAGNPTVSITSTTTAQAVAGLYRLTYNAQGQIITGAAATSADITTALGYTPVNKAGDTLSGTLTFTSGTITGLAAPTSASDAATKQYVDNLSLGIDAKASVRVATTASGALATAFAAGQVIDGITLVTGDRILIKNQAAPAENGIYIVSATGAPVRSTDTNAWSQVPGAFTFVETGTIGADTGWLSTADQGGTLNTTAMPWVQFNSAVSYTAGTGLTLTGNAFSITSPIPTTLGGTGLTTLGTANQILGVNAAGTGAEYKTVTAGTAISVTPTAGVLTIANTGVTSILGTANQITASAATGAVTLSVPTAFVAPGSVAVTTFLSRSITDAVAAAGTTQGTATALTADYNIVSTSTPVTAFGVALPTPSAPFGREVTVKNSSANTITVYPNSGAATIDSLAGGIGISVTAGDSASFVSTSAAAWQTTEMSLVAGSGVTVTNVNGTQTISSTGVTSIVAGTGISVSGSGAITVNNTGVTSVGLTLPAMFTVTGSPVTTTGSLTATLTSQAANTIFAAPNGSAGAPTFRALVAADLSFLQLYRENASAATVPVAGGVNAVAIGSGASAPAIGSIAIGDGTSAYLQGGKVAASGKFATSGDAQSGLYVLRNITTNATPTELYLDGALATARLVMPLNSTWTFDVLVTARTTSATGGAAGYRFVGVINKDATAVSTVIIGAVSKTVIAETNTPWDGVASADTTNGSLRILVTGEAAKTIRWVAVVNTTEVTN